MGFTPAWAPAAIIVDVSETRSSTGDEAAAAAVWMVDK